MRIDVSKNKSILFFFYKKVIVFVVVVVTKVAACRVIVAHLKNYTVNAVQMLSTLRFHVAQSDQHVIGLALVHMNATMKSLIIVTQPKIVSLHIS